MLTTTLARAFTRTDRSKTAMWWWQVDRTTFWCVIALMITGLALSFSTSSEAASDNHLADAFYYTKRHSVFFIGALVLMIGASQLSIKGIERVGLLIFALALMTMIIIVFVGTEAKGGQRWLNLGPVMLQPSEFLKPALVIMIAWMFSEAQAQRDVPGLNIAFWLYLVSVGLLLLQPDVGQSFLITVTFMACFFISGVPMRWIAILSGLSVVAGASLYFIHPHVRERLDDYFNPKGDHTQIDAARAAIAKGGLFGQGMNEGEMKARLPDQHTDFAFSVLAEEFGLIATLILISIFFYIVARNLAKSVAATDSFRQIAIAGLSIMLGLQVLINVSVNLAIMPPKGMTLPFISYGGSSLLASGLVIGLLLALTRKRTQNAVDDDPSQW